MAVKCQELTPYALASITPPPCLSTPPQPVGCAMHTALPILHDLHALHGRTRNSRLKSLSIADHVEYEDHAEKHRNTVNSPASTLKSSA